jgi:hypothetical protein|tara:strand:+ start:16028 stop:17524 length:1497 start_codon:yes stop_codon:yes gene_type:complete
MTKAYLSNFAKGANQSANPLIMDDDSLKVQNGIVTSYKLGVLLKRLGYSRVGDVAEANNSITGLFDSRETPSVQRELLTVNDSGDDHTQLFYNNSGTWTEIAAAEAAWANFANINVEMETFIGYTFFVGHGTTDGFLPVGSLTDTTFSTSTNVTGMPQGKFIKRYRDRLYVANLFDGSALPYRVGISDLPSGGTLAWTEYQADTGLFDVDYSEEITGMEENWDYLIIFNSNSAYYYNQDSLKKLWDVGCSNHRTLKNYSAYMIWANGDGVWVSTSMGRPQNVAGPVIDFIRAGTPANFFGEVVNEEYHLYVGSVTVDGVSYANVDLIFHFPTATWRWEELSDNMTIFSAYNSSGDISLHMGDDAGNVWNKSKYTDTSPVFSDSTVSGSGTVISVNCETKPYYFDDPSIRKKLQRVTVISDRALGVQMKMRVFDKNVRALSSYIPVGQLTKYINVFEGKNIEFNMIQFEFSESSTNEYFSILGIIIEYEQVAIPNISKK